MLSPSLLRTSARAALRSAAAATAATTPRIAVPASALHTSRVLQEINKPPSPPPGAFARTDDSITVEYPEDHELPTSVPVQGRGGLHMKRTLASFSMEGKVCVVTGGARGLGLVMGQGLVISGANLAIVDMNSKSYLQFPSVSTNLVYSEASKMVKTPFTQLAVRIPPSHPSWLCSISLLFFLLFFFSCLSAQLCSFMHSVSLCFPWKTAP
jgi:hypothetical protein